MIDRRIAIALLLLAVGYALQTRGFQVTFLVDPVGPRAFPLMLAGLLAGAAAVLFARPAAEPVVWPPRAVAGRAAALVAALLAYAALIEPLGYLIATSLTMLALSLLFGGGPLRSAVAGVALVAALYLLFYSALGLHLPPLPFGG